MGNISIADVSKRYGAVEVIKNINLEVGEGEFVVLVGPSGCGKSTLLRMIAGLEDISGGTISIAGRVVNKLPPQKRDVAMVFQNYALYPHYTVFQNMAFGLKLKSTPKDEIEEKVHKAADTLGLSELLKRYPKNLSGGQRQRVAMGRAIVRDPVLYLFDEPLSNLDAKLRISMRTEIKSLHQSLKRTTVYVTHDQVEAMTMADRIVIMRDGIIEQQGSPMNIYNNPANQFVAGFIGAPTTNFFDAHLVKTSDSHSKLEIKRGMSIKIPDGIDHGGDVVLGVRPEHLMIGATANTLIAGKVALVEPTGPSDYLIVKTDAGNVTVVAQNGRAKVGDQVSLGAELEHLHLFHNETGRTLPLSGANHDGPVVTNQAATG